MELTTHRLNRKHQPVVDRVALILDDAARLVKQRNRRGLGRVEVAVTTRRGIADLVCAAHEDLFGWSDPQGWDNCAGTTTVNRRGTLVIVNADMRRAQHGEVDKTLLHELTHAAQLNRPGVRDWTMWGIAHNLGIGFMSEVQVEASVRQMEIDEREAEQAEGLHRKLARAVR